MASTPQPAQPDADPIAQPPGTAFSALIDHVIGMHRVREYLAATPRHQPLASAENALPGLFLAYVTNRDCIGQVKDIAANRKFWDGISDNIAGHPIQIPAYWHFLSPLDNYLLLREALTPAILNRRTEQGTFLPGHLGTEAEQILLLAYMHSAPEEIATYLKRPREGTAKRLETARKEDGNGRTKQEQLIVDLSARALLGVLVGADDAVRRAQELFVQIENHCRETAASTYTGEVTAQTPYFGQNDDMLFDLAAWAISANQPLYFSDTTGCNASAIDYWGLIQQVVGEGPWSAWCRQHDSELGTELAAVVKSLQSDEPPADAGVPLDPFEVPRGPFLPHGPDSNPFHLIYHALASPTLASEAVRQMNVQYAQATAEWYRGCPLARSQGAPTDAWLAQVQAGKEAVAAPKSDALEVIYYTCAGKYRILTSGKPSRSEKVCVTLPERWLELLCCYVDEKGDPLSKPPNAPKVCNKIKYGSKRGLRIDWRKKTEDAKTALRKSAGKIRAAATEQLAKCSDPGALAHLRDVLIDTGSRQKPFRGLNFCLQPVPIAGAKGDARHLNPRVKEH